MSQAPEQHRYRETFARRLLQLNNRDVDGKAADLRNTRKDGLFIKREAGPGKGRQEWEASLAARMILPFDMTPPVCWLGSDDLLIREAVDGELVDPDNMAHLKLAMAWLARLHSFPVSAAHHSFLVEHGFDHYLGETLLNRLEQEVALIRQAFRGHRSTELIVSLTEQLWSRCRPVAVPSYCHGDFKPDNIVIDRQGKVRPIDWVDFGLGDAAYDLMQFVSRIDPVKSIAVIRDYLRLASPNESATEFIARGVDHTVIIRYGGWARAIVAGNISVTSGFFQQASEKIQQFYEAHRVELENSPKASIVKMPLHPPRHPLKDFRTRMSENPRRLLIDGTKLADPASDGIRRYVSGLLAAMQHVTLQHSDWQVDVLLGPRVVPLAEINPWLEPAQRVNYSRRVAQRIVDFKRRFTYPLLPEYDLIHLTLPNSWTGFQRIKGPRIVTVHDLSHLACPQWQSDLNNRSLQAGLQGALDEDATLIAVSDFTRRELADRCGVEQSIVTGEGCDRERFHPHWSPSQRQAIREKYSLSDLPFVLSVGTLEPRKNLLGTVQAFRRLVEQGTRLQLAIVGRYGWGDLDPIRQAADGCEQIRWLGYVPDSDLPPLYAEATALSYISHYEGFGLPPLEAMSCGTPVVYSAATAVEDVVADAGWAADPNDVASICDCFSAVSEQPQQCRHLGELALQRAQLFNWHQVAERTWAAYMQAVESKKETQAA